jgi:hypothetical protein
MRSRLSRACTRSAAIVLGLCFAGVAVAGGDIDMAPSPSPSPSADDAGGDQPAAVVKDPKVARKWLAAAQQLTSKGDYSATRKKSDDAKAQYENAVTAYQKAIEAGDDVTVYYALALVEDKLGALPDAYAHLTIVVTAQPPVKADALKKAQAKLDEITGKVGVVTFNVQPEGATVLVDGKAYGDAPLKDPIVLVPGTYTASFTLVGYQPKELELKIEAGAGVEKKVGLEPVPIKITPNTFEPEPPPIAIRPSRTPLIVGASFTAIFTAGAIAAGASAVSQHRAYVDPTFTNKERADAQKLGKTMAHLCDAGIGLAVASAAFTAYWYQWHYKKERDVPADQAREVPKVDVIPYVQPQGGGFAVVGSF